MFNIYNNLRPYYHDFMNIRIREHKNEIKHQIYTPLTIIKGYISMLMEDLYGNQSYEAQNVLKIMDESIDTLVRTINKIDL
jgi:signal transduction histidine kinase